jgi:hypothetical protein
LEVARELPDYRYAHVRKKEEKAVEQDKARAATDGTFARVLDLPRRHRSELAELAEQAEQLDKPLAEYIAGTVVADHHNTLNFGVFKVVNRTWTQSYRAREATIDASTIEGAEWVTVNTNTTLRRLLNEYGDRLLGYDAKRDEWTIEILAWDVVDSSVRTVRVLVRHATKSGADG